jgi:transposase-like protein
MSKVNWNEENTARLEGMVTQGEVVAQDRVSEIAEEMDTTPRSIGAKLRRLGYEVEKATGRASTWTEQEEAELRSLVESRPNEMTYSELAAVFMDGKYNSKQIQGKVLNLELYDKVRKAEKKTAPRTYTPEEEQRFVAMVQGGASIEDLSAEFGKSAASVRGKALSLLRSNDIEAMPEQRVSTAKSQEDPIDALGDAVADMTVEEIAEKTEKTVRGIKSILSRRGITAADYDGAARREKLDSSKED